MENILALLYGLVFGIANIIPGVSGGTMLVVFGCYDKVCGALTFNLKEIRKNIVFLIFFGIGAVCGIFGFAFLITWLFENCPVQTNLFFMGLILGSVPLILRNATVSEKFRPSCLLPFAVGLAAVVALTILQNGAAGDEPCYIEVTQENGSSYAALVNTSDRTVNQWTIELENGSFTPEAFRVSGAEVVCKRSLTDEIKGWFGGADQAPVKAVITGKFPPGSVFTFTYKGTDLTEENVSLSMRFSMDAGFFVKLLLATFVAAVAMIIPGVSGSFVMVTLGTYAPVVGAIKALDIVTLIPVAVGAAAGIILGARLVVLLMKRFRLMTFSVILGLVAGSVYAVFPAGFGLNAATLAGAAAFLLGGAVSVLVGKNTKVE